MKNDKRNIGRDPHIAPGVYYIQQELSARIDGDRIIVEKKESEDERIRKEIVSALKFANDGGVYDKHIAYLEKRKEQTEELSIRLNGLMQEYVKAGEDEEEQEHRLKCYQLFWDALEDSEFFEQKEQKNLFESGRGLYYYDGEKTTYCGYPATEENPYDFAMSQQKEQKEQKPKHFELKAGKWYICHRAFCCRADHLTVKEGERFMCEKDGIVKGFVIKEPEKYFKECSAPAPMEDEQKPVARENDFVSKEWSEEDEAFLKTAIAICNRYSHKDIADWLKSLKNRGNFLKSNTNSPSWSEEDELNIGWLIAYLKGESAGEYYDEMMRESLADWLKSLRPQPRWKPSEEQMAALEKAIIRVHSDDEIPILCELRQQLKKLM